MSDRLEVFLGREIEVYPRIIRDSTAHRQVSRPGILFEATVTHFTSDRLPGDHSSHCLALSELVMRPLPLQHSRSEPIYEATPLRRQNLGKQVTKKGISDRRLNRFADTFDLSCERALNGMDLTRAGDVNLPIRQYLKPIYPRHDPTSLRTNLRTAS